MAHDHRRLGSGGGHGGRATTTAASTPGKQTLVEIAYPHAASIQRALGTAIPGTAIVDPSTCAQRGVPAFTDRGVTTFSSEQPTLHVAAHEAAHLLQHAGGTRDGGMGAEGHAHAVADAVTSGGDARGLVGDRGNAVAPAVRNYTEIPLASQNTAGGWNLGSDARVADNGEVATSKTDRNVLFANPTLVDEANTILRAKHSAVTLFAGGPQLTGLSPDGSGPRSLDAVTTTVSSQTGNTNYTDCGRMAREVQGTAGADTPAKAVYADGGGQEQETPTATIEPATMRDEILVTLGLGTTPGEARTAYLAMDPGARATFDEQHGINRHAAPKVGEAYVSVRDNASTMAGFNYHWGGVIIEAAHDRVTLENFARPGTSYDSQNDLWYFDMYGPPTHAGQTWHDRWVEGNGRGGVGVGAPASNGVTMTTRTSSPIGAADADFAWIDSVFDQQQQQQQQPVTAPAGNAPASPQDLPSWNPPLLSFGRSAQPGQQQQAPAWASVDDADVQAVLRWFQHGDPSLLPSSPPLLSEVLAPPNGAPVPSVTAQPGQQQQAPTWTSPGDYDDMQAFRRWLQHGDPSQRPSSPPLPEVLAPPNDAPVPSAMELDGSELGAPIAPVPGAVPSRGGVKRRRTEAPAASSPTSSPTRSLTYEAYALECTEPAVKNLEYDYEGRLWRVTDVTLDHVWVTPVS